MDRIKNVISKIKKIDYKLLEDAQKRLDNLTKPLGSLGRLEELAKQITGITTKVNPELKNKVIFTLAADHGVTEEKVSAYPKEVTAQMVYNFLNGGAGINVLANHVGARVVVVDMGITEKIPATRHESWRGGSAMKFGGKNQNFKDKKVNFGTKNMTKGPAMTKDEAIKSINAGIEIFEDEYKNGIDIIGIGEMGIGNTTSASTITVCFTNAKAEDVTGRGTGLDDRGVKNKIEVIKKALKINNPNKLDPIDVLSKVGGFEIGGLVGIILTAASKNIPIVLDGFISSSAGLIAYSLEPKTKDYMIASHVSVEKGHKIILDYIGLKPLLNLDLRLGEGTGAALGINLSEAAVKILTQMATFKSAGVSQQKGQ